MNFLFHKEKWGCHGLKDYVITGQKLSLFPEPESNFLLLGHLDLLEEVIVHSGGVLVFKFKGWPSPCCPECLSDRFLLPCSFYRNILFKEPRKQFRAGARAAAIFLRRKAHFFTHRPCPNGERRTECFFMRFLSV